MNIEDFSHRHQRIPDFHGILPGNPDFVAEIAGVAGAGNVHGNPRDFAVRDAKVFEVGNIRARDGMEQSSGSWSLESERGGFLRNVVNVDVEAESILPEPAEAGIGGGPAVVIFAEAGDGAVVNDLAFGIAPAAVDDLIQRNLIDVAGDDAIDEASGVAAGDAIFEERRDVQEGSGVADGVVLVLVVHFVDTDGVIAGPLAIAEAFAEGESAFVKSGSDGHVRRPPRLRVRRDYRRMGTRRTRKGSSSEMGRWVYPYPGCFWARVRKRLKEKRLEQNSVLRECGRC